MIYIAKNGIKETEFRELLESSKKFILAGRGNGPIPSSSDFELVVLECMRKAAKGTKFDGAIEKTGPGAFPDIVAKKYYGAEVKMTINDHWTSTGNSVLESLRVDDVERIYIMFGKFGGKFDVKYRLYQECLPEVSVTHSPRYRINMELAVGKSIFDKMKVDYDVFRKTDPIKRVKDYYRAQLEEGEELWWIDQGVDDKGVSPIIRPFRKLSKAEQENFIVETMVLFPEIFGNSPSKFERPAAYLITEYNAVSAHLRDSFSAGGKMTLKIKGKKIVVQKIADNLRKRAKEIFKKISKMDEEKLIYYWRVKKLEKNRVGQWEKLLDNKSVALGNKISSSDIFYAGLK